MRLLLLIAAALAVANHTANDSRASVQVPQMPQRWQIWSLDPQAMAAAGCSNTDAAKVKLCEARKQASFYHTRGMSVSEEWCSEVYVTVPCWPPCFCNHTIS